MTKEKKDKTSDKIVQLEEQLKRALADYANLKKRTEEERAAVVKFANSVLTVKFLEILDSLETAQKNLKDPGLDLVIKKFKDTLVSENIKEIAAQDQNFDPNLHEAISTVDGDKEGQIVEVLQKGYELDGKILRPARVKVVGKVEKVENHD